MVKTKSLLCQQKPFRVYVDLRTADPDQVFWTLNSMGMKPTAHTSVHLVDPGCELLPQ